MPQLKLSAWVKSLFVEPKAPVGSASNVDSTAVDSTAEDVSQATPPDGFLPPTPAARHLGGPLHNLEQSPTEAKPPIVQFVNVTKSFPLQKGQRFIAFEDLNLTIQDHRAGEILVLLGPSGCGKSTILGLISGLLSCDSGKIMIYGREISGPNQYSATVPQSYTCFPWLTVLQNVEFGLAVQGVKKAERKERAMEYLSKVDLADRWNSRPKQLSGGMQQRVAIARTLAVQRPIVLMDEPFGALDAQTREEMQQMLLQLWSEEKNTIIFVTHDIPEAVLLADRILVFPLRPVRTLREIAVSLPRPRAPHLIRNEDFILLCEQLRHLLGKPHSATPSDSQQAAAERC
jgi:NitT/TauT family transport system ATP-binding protein